MKICAIICEYNPFHNGHEHLIRQAKELTNADAILCIMSGNFVQRGEAAILSKFERAKHAVLCGADVVIELPTVFATSNAEIFADGAIALLSTIPEVTHLCFGAELANRNLFLHAATALLNEPKEVTEIVKRLTSEGVGYAQAIATARAQVADERLFQSPNNILGIEYTKAILRRKAKIDILPIQRIGSGYNQTSLSGEYASASAIRMEIFNGNFDNLSVFLPQCVLECLPNCNLINLDSYEKLAILQKTPQDLAQVLDCTEGLENAFWKAAQQVQPLEQTLTSPRYTSSRIRRIALQNLLGITEQIIRDCQTAPLYLTPLCYRAQKTDVLTALSKASIPFLSCGKNQRNLSAIAKICKEIDEHAQRLYALLVNQVLENKPIIIH